MRLCDLSDQQLDAIMNFSSEELETYVSELISKFYPHILTGSDDYEKLLKGYASSIFAEKLYREHSIFQAGFKIIYTKTGLIRDIVNEIYYTDDTLITH
jgi:hypothetical protein